MRRISITVAVISLLSLVACGVGTTGLSPESSRRPKGNPSALVFVTEYGDFQCPACKTSHELITKSIFQKYSDTIRFEFKQFPLTTIHEYSLEAAEASECAADQGKFWEFVDLAYAQQEQLSSTALRDWAKVLGLDVSLFDRCIRSDIKKNTIMADEAEGEKLGVDSTPTYFVNGQRITDLTLQTVSDAIDQALASAMKVPL